MIINNWPLLMFSAIVISFTVMLKDCLGGGTNTPTDTPAPPEQAVFIEYDWTVGSDLISRFKDKAELTTHLNSIFNRKIKESWGTQDFRTGLQIKLLYKADDVRLPNPESGWGVFSKAADNYNKMMRYAQCYKYPNKVNFLSTDNPDLTQLEYPYQVLSVNHLIENDDLNNKIIAGYSQYRSEGGGIGSPAQRPKRWSYIFSNDIITFMEADATVNMYDKQNILIYIVAHELGHQIASLCDNPNKWDDPDQIYHWYNSLGNNDVMVTRASREVFKGSQGATLVRDWMYFCSLSHNNAFGCKEYLKDVTIGN